MALWTPEYLNAALWLDAADTSTIVESSGVVAQWRDKSGSGNHAINAFGPRALAVNFSNGLSAVAFSTTQYALASEIDIRGKGVYIVSRHDNASIGQLLSHSSANIQFRFEANHAIGVVGNPVIFGNKTIAGGALSTPCILSIEAAAAGGAGYIDGANTTALGSQSSPVFINRLGARGSGSEPLTGAIAEIIVTHAIEERQKVEGYLAHKWGIAGRLPAAHPYKSVAPIGTAISGIVRDRFGVPCQRKVYAVSRPTDATAPKILAHGLSDPTTGTYELAIPSGEEVTRVVVSEDDEPLLNDLVDRVIPA